MTAMPSFDLPTTLGVLVVEDENIVAKDIAQTLKSAGHTVCGIASNGLQAVELAETRHPDLILMDIRLQGDMDGIAAARRIRERLNIPVIFLTAYADDATLERAATAEPYGYILKPFDEKELLVAILMAAVKHRAFALLDERVRQRTEEVGRTEFRRRQMAEVAQLGVFALATRDIEEVMERAIAVVGDTLGTELVHLAELSADGETLTIRAGRGWNPGVVGSATVGADTRSQAGYTLLSAEPVIVADLANEARFTPSALLVRHDVVSGISVVIHAPGADGRPYGVLGAHTRQRRQFSEGDIHLLQAVANVIAAALMRAASEEQVRAADRLASAHARAMEIERAGRSVAEAASQAKDEFLAMLAHELRNPLAAIRSAVAVLDRIGSHDDGTTRWREIIRRQVGHLARVVDDLLDVNRAIAGKIILEVRPVNVADVVRHQIQTLRDAGLLGSHDVTVDLDDAWIQGDIVRVEQVVANLVLNAVKYTPAEGRIAIAVRREAGQALVCVQDSGIGIPASLLPRVFDLFVQGGRNIDRAQGGLGIGLTLVRRLIELHGGSAEAQSDGEGKGSRFTIRVPLLDGVEAEPPGSAAPARVSPRCVLVIEDNADARETLRQFLKLSGHEVHDAEDARTAVQIALECDPDVALIDIGLREVDGYELCRRLRALDRGPAMRLVAVTGYGQTADRQRAADAGFDAHLVKPVDPDRLLGVIAELTV